MFTMGWSTDRFPDGLRAWRRLGTVDGAEVFLGVSTSDEDVLWGILARVGCALDEGDVA